jgi:murein DD-endopeptidase MepM/ murein hydrolase activator NlpD
VSRRRNLMGTRSHFVRPVILFLCVVAMVFPSLARASKSTRSTNKPAAKKLDPKKPADKNTRNAAPKAGTTAATKKAAAKPGTKPGTTSAKSASKPAAKTASKTASKTAASKATTRPASRTARSSAARTASASRGQAGSRKAKSVAYRRHHAARSAPRVVRAPSPPRFGSRGIIDEHVHVRRGDSIERILYMRGIGASTAREWMSAAEEVYDLRQVRPRHGLTLRFDRATRSLDSIRYEIDDSSLMVLERQEDGAVEARVEALPYFREVQGIAGRISQGLRDDAIDAGVPPSIAAAMAEVFGWEVEIERLEPGDEFRVIYENIWEVGRQTPLTGQILGAEIVTRGRTYSAILFEDDDGSAYYAPNGESLTRTFLRYPVEFTEISSEFSLERFHPVLHRTRPHLGVDLAAPSAPPGRAAASGTVLASGRSGGLGIAVRLSHGDGVTTTYGHLSEIAPGIVEGRTVERGQVIGWVGSTGLATGPHLHYEVALDGEQLDPMRIRLARTAAVPAHLRRSFERARTAVIQHLAALPETDYPVRVALSPSACRAE